MDFPSTSYSPSDTTERDIKSLFSIFVGLGDGKIAGFCSYVANQSPTSLNFSIHTVNPMAILYGACHITFDVLWNYVWIIRKVFDIQLEPFFLFDSPTRSYDKHENCPVSADSSSFSFPFSMRHISKQETPIRRSENSQQHTCLLCYLLSGRYFAKIHNNAIKFFLFLVFLLTTSVRLGHINFNSVIGIDFDVAKKKRKKLFLSPPQYRKG